MITAFIELLYWLLAVSGISSVGVLLACALFSINPREAE
jgi:hypothetical protein